MKKATSPEYVSVADAARMIGIPRMTLCRLLREGKLPGVGMAVQGTTGRWRYYVRRSGVDAFLRGGDRHGN